MKRGILLLVATLLMLTITGCITPPTIYMKLSPNPIVMKPGDKRIEIDFSIEVSGAGEVYVDKVILKAVDKDGKTIANETIDIQRQIPGFGIGFEHEIWLPISYEQAKETSLSQLVVEVTGQRYLVFSVDVVIEEIE